MWELDHKESWASENWCFWTAVLEKTLESPLDCRETSRSIWRDIIGRVDAEALILWLPNAGWLIGYNPDAGKDWGLEEKGATEDVMIGWHHWLDGITCTCNLFHIWWHTWTLIFFNTQRTVWHHRLHGHEFEWTLGLGDGQGGLVCCDSWGRKESDTTEWLNWTELKVT